MDQQVDGPESEHSATTTEPDGPAEPVARRGEWFFRAAALVGDLSSPFYGEERRRDVWNEASAVGLQLVVWLSLTTAAAILWIGSAEAVPYALVLLAVVGLPSLVSISYARRLDVSIDAPPRLRASAYPALAAGAVLRHRDGTVLRVVPGHRRSELLAEDPCHWPLRCPVGMR